MIGSRTRSRELALQTLFCWDVGPTVAPEALEETMAHAEASEEVRAFARVLVEGVLADLPAIDRAIAAAADNWSVERLAVVDRNVLRLAIHELMSADDVPPAVAIDEAIELGKRFSTAQSGSFINGVLDRVRRDLEITIDGVTDGDADAHQDPKAPDETATDGVETE